jgi:hypothetical protein
VETIAELVYRQVSPYFSNNLAFYLKAGEAPVLYGGFDA